MLSPWLVVAVFVTTAVDLVGAGGVELKFSVGLGFVMEWGSGIEVGWSFFPELRDEIGEGGRDVIVFESITLDGDGCAHVLEIGVWGENGG